MVTKVETETKILIGKEVGSLPGQKLANFADNISAQLKVHRTTMIQYSPGQIFRSMIAGRTVLAYNEQEEVGFAQIWKYAETDYGTVYEFGSWLSLRRGMGMGRAILRAAEMKLMSSIDSNGELIAIVAADNKQAKKIIEVCGAEEVDLFPSPIIKDELGNWQDMIKYRLIGGINET